LATGLIVLAVLRIRPEIVTGAAETPERGQFSFAAYGLLVALGLAIFVAPLACPWPDGLEKVAATLGLAAGAPHPSFTAPVADYRLPFIGSPAIATAIAGAVGTVIAFVAAYLLARVLVPVLSARKEDAPSRG
jgi:cobalt/nickel transport protein